MRKDKQKQEKEVIYRSTVDLMNISDYVGDHFTTLDGGVMDVFQVLGYSLLAADEGEVQRQIHSNARYYRLQQKDFKFITLNYPTNTRTQQGFLRSRLAKTVDPVQRELLNDEIATLEYLEEYRTDIETFIVLYADSEKDYTEQRQALLTGSGFMVKVLDRDKKLSLLRKLGNMNTEIKI